ncbi:MAG TPA: SlyX family protein [Candidatus Didemnitutus sp.]|nr:SlyX family protein [Candidatus Didemnitutus sp.]
MSDAERITRLEERLVHLQQHVAAQDKAMLEMHEEIVALRRELALARMQMPGAAPTEPASENERPPHY